MAKKKVQVKAPANKTAQTQAAAASPIPGENAAQEDTLVDPVSRIQEETATSSDVQNHASEVGAPLQIDQAIDILVAEGYQVVKEESTVLDTRPTVVIPYKKSAAAGEELRYALRAWEKYFPGCKIVVIGDREDWFSPEVICIEMEVLSNNPQIDVANKLMVAIAADEIPEDFIWSNDDILPVSPIHIGDIQLLKANGLLTNSKPGLNGVYAENMQRTIELLQKYKLPVWDYSTHTPFYFNKEKLSSVISQLRADETGYLISSLYFNSYFPEINPVIVAGDANCFFTAYVYRDNPPMSVVNEVFKSRKFVNYNDKAYSAIRSVIESKYSDKSTFEI